MGIPVRAEAFVFLQDDFCPAPSCQLLTSVTPKAKSGINPRTIKASHAAQLIVSGFMAVRATCCQREGTPGFQNCFAHSLLRKKTAGAAKMIARKSGSKMHPPEQVEESRVGTKRVVERAYFQRRQTGGSNVVFLLEQGEDFIFFTEANVNRDKSQRFDFV